MRIRLTSAGSEALGMRAIVLAAALFTGALSPADAGRPMTQAEISTYLRAKPGTTYKLNPANPEHYGIIEGALSGTMGPRLQKTLGTTRAMAAASANAATLGAVPTATNPDGTGDINIIDNFNEIDSAYEFTASGLSSVMGGTITTTIKTLLIDTLARVVLDSAVGTQMGQGTHFTVTVTGKAPAGHAVAAAAVISYVPNDSPSTVKTVLVTSGQAPTPVNACLQAPNYCTKDSTGNCSGGHDSSCTNNRVARPKITMCYYRGSQQTCDYYNAAPAYPTNYVFPTIGNAAYSTAPVSPVYGTMTAILENPVAGGGCQISTTATGALPASQWWTSGNSVFWNINPTSIADPNGCINKYPDWTTVNFYFTAEVQLAGKTPSGQPLYGRLSFTSDSTQSGQSGIYIVPQLNIQQGCFAKGTRIAVKGGGERNIEAFMAEPGEFVESQGKEAKRVLATTSGIEPHPMKRVKAGEFSVLATREHPFLTQRGLVEAQELKAGDVLLTRKGKRALTSVADEKYEGKVYNLHVGNEKGAAKGENLFYANGFLVGDGLIQNRLAVLKNERKSKDPAYLRGFIHPDWLADYDLHVKRERSAAKKKNKDR